MNQPTTRCVICFSMASIGDLSALCCGHTFHFFCIWAWMKKRMQCPICRRWIETDELVGILSFRVIKSEFSLKNDCQAEVQQLLDSSFALSLRRTELRGAYVLPRVKTMWLLERMKDFEARNVKEEIQCYACRKRLDLTDVSALRCGHTFHLLCISGRVREHRKCPICKEEADENTIIPRLFFETIDKDENSYSPVQEARVLFNQVTDALNRVEAELELTCLQIEHNSILLRILSKMTNAFVRVLQNSEL